MKLQYLGDSKDSFKWDYHDHLAAALDFDFLTILPMMTPDDGTDDGKTEPETFPAREVILQFCRSIRSSRNISTLTELPSTTGSTYTLTLHKPGILLDNFTRSAYFNDVPHHERQLLFVDPDTGFEPEKNSKITHLRYSETASLIARLPASNVVSVFQHSRRVKFTEDYKNIEKRLLIITPSLHTTAIYWRHLMFIQFSRSKGSIDRVREINREYALMYPVKSID